jgi:hypothetical protein
MLSSDSQSARTSQNTCLSGRLTPTTDDTAAATEIAVHSLSNIAGCCAGWQGTAALISNCSWGACTRRSPSAVHRSGSARGVVEAQPRGIGRALHRGQAPPAEAA